MNSSYEELQSLLSSGWVIQGFSVQQPSGSEAPCYWIVLQNGIELRIAHLELQGRGFVTLMVKAVS